MMNVEKVGEKVFIYNLDQIDTVVAYLLKQFKNCDVFTFTGPLGAGKTTLIQRLLRKQGIDGVITSPTFTYVNVYTNPRGQHYYHFDCYRLGSLDDFLEAGFGEYLYQQNSWSFVEWPAVIKPLLQSRVCHVAIDYYGDQERTLTCTLINNRS